MVEKIKASNVNRKMIGGDSPVRVIASSSQDTIVENIAEKRYLWTARAFAIITAISICCNIVLIMAITQILPLYRVEPFLLTFKNKQEQVLNIIPVNTSLESERAITEVFVRQYVLLRSTFDTDIAEMEARWLPGGPMQEMSSAGVFDYFLKNAAKPSMDVIRTKSLRREVRIITVNELSRGLWQVEFETQDMYPTSTSPELNYWTASLNITYRRKTVRFSERLKNPVGFTVTNFSLSRKKIN